MTDRVRTITVVLDDDYRTDDATEILRAIKMVKGVEQAVLGRPSDMTTWLARQTVGNQYQAALHEAIRKVRDAKV